MSKLCNSIAKRTTKKMDVKTKLPSLFFILFIIIMATKSTVLVLPDVLYYNLTNSRMDLFVSQHQRQYAANIKAMELRIKEFKAEFSNRMEVISYQGEIFEAKLNELENTLIPLEVLDEVNSYCVQRYRGKLVNFNVHTTSLANCIQKGTSVVGSLVSTAEGTLSRLKAYYANQFANALKACNTKYKPMDKALASCIIGAVNSTTETTVSNTLTFGNQLKSTACSANLKVKEVSDCYTTVVAGGFKSIGEVWGLIENCITGHEFCPTCGDEHTDITGRCPYHLSWHLTPNDVSTDTIINPFKGISPSAPCLQINFITNTSASAVLKK